MSKTNEHQATEKQYFDGFEEIQLLTVAIAHLQSAESAESLAEAAGYLQAAISNLRDEVKEAVEGLEETLTEMCVELDRKAGRRD